LLDRPTIFWSVPHFASFAGSWKPPLAFEPSTRQVPVTCGASSTSVRSPTPVGAVVPSDRDDAPLANAVIDTSATTPNSAAVDPVSGPSDDPIDRAWNPSRQRPAYGHRSKTFVGSRRPRGVIGDWCEVLGLRAVARLQLAGVAPTGALAVRRRGPRRGRGGGGCWRLPRPVLRARLRSLLGCLIVPR